ncbi:zinc-ribbon domain-containing protein [Shimia marina]|uniref:Family finger-like domain protein n=1 Tax=Shimia marina TaxID=321267 RepID=A0A0P1EUF0_9RHOB|nr:zinc-ribbon domain-containing protein [Shimia marina]CUH54272.1 family finger-like domain protein [Shimia marina]SFD99122.1 MJ0042 family finger-like domain-containing protein [Shimia marina]
MRLTCPNCGAQYEVPDDIIPTSGRDVQCSSCGNTWFQVHPDHVDPSIEAPHSEEPDSAPHDPDEAMVSQDTTLASEQEPFEEVEPPALSISDAAEPADVLEDESTDADDLDLDAADWDLETDDAWLEPEDTISGTAAALATFGDEAETENDDSLEAALAQTIAQVASEDADTLTAQDETSEDDTGTEAEETAPEPEDEPQRQRRGIDDSVADILRAEAEYESQARAAEEPQALETQGDLGLDEAAAPAPMSTRIEPTVQSTLRKPRRSDDTDPTAEPAAARKKDTRRDLLPDIEDINSTLRSTSTPQRNPDLGQGPDNRARRARGFRLGFGLVVLLAICAVFVYGSHDMLSQKYPAMSPYIESFVVSADATRIWLDDQIAQLFLKLNQMIG